MEVKCRFCRGSEYVGHGFRNNKSSKKSVYKCLQCGKTFTQDDGFLKMRFDKKIIVKCLDLLVGGSSLRYIVGYMKREEGIELTHSTILRWKAKYAKMLKGFEGDLKLTNCGDSVIHSDETMIKVSGDFFYLWSSVDHDTRYLLSSFLTPTRGTSDARRMFLECKNKMDSDPKEVVTDGLWSYPRAFKKAYFKHSPPRTYHVVASGIRSKAENNRIERFFGSFFSRSYLIILNSI